MSQHGYPERLSGRSKVLQEDGICQPTIELLVESLTGSAFQMTVSPNDTVYLIKTKIFRVEGIPISQQHLLYNFKELNDSASLNDYSIKDGSTLKLVLSIKGGPISTRRLPLPSDDEIQWRDIRDFVENNRDEALEWLPPGCKVLVFKDGDNVNLVKVIEEEDQSESYSPLSDYSFSEETALTMCKMIDLRCKMETLSMKRNKKKNTSCMEKDMKKKSPLPLKKTLSEETLSSTINCLFDETPNFTKYKPNRFYSNDSHPQTLSTYSTIFHSDTSYGKFANKSPLNDKYGHWPPIGSYSDLASNDNAVSSASRAWRTSNPKYPSREPAAPADYLIRPANIMCNDAADRFNNGSILAGTSNALLPSYINGNVNMDAGNIDTFHKSGSGKSVFLGERSVMPTDVMESDRLETSNVLTANIGHSVRGEYGMSRLLGEEAESSIPDRFDSRSQYYYRQPGTGPTHLKRLPRTVMFGSNSHLNNLQDAGSRGEITEKIRRGDRPFPTGESRPNRPLDLRDEKVSKKNLNLSHSVSNLCLDSRAVVELHAPRGEFSSHSELDRYEDAEPRRVSAAKPGTMMFSSSTSDLLNLRRNRILPSLSRHRNCEHLDVSDERLDKVEIVKHENLHYRPGGEVSDESRGDCEACGSSTERMLAGRNLMSDLSDGRFGKIADAGRFDMDSRRSLGGIRLVRNDDSTDRRFDGSGASPKSLEVGSERRRRRVRKIPKMDHDDFQDCKDSTIGRQSAVGCGRGYEAVIRKTSDDSRGRVLEFHSENVSDRERFAPLYERCDARQSNFDRSSILIKDSGAFDKFHSARSDASISNGSDAGNGKPRISPPSSTVVDEKRSELKEGTGGKQNRVRCAMCKRRLSVATVHICRCGVIFCAPHRYKEIHGCRYDYKAEGQERLRRANPPVSAPKLPKI